GPRQPILSSKNFTDLVRESAERNTSGTTLYRLGYARYEFLVTGGLTAATLLAERCVATHASPLLLNKPIPIDVTSVAGIVKLSITTDPSHLLGFLITAAEAAREANAATMLYDSRMKLVHERSFKILNSIKLALASKDQLHLVFQPRVRVSDGAIIGAEALLRWSHPELGNLPPAEFIPIAEQTSFMSLITDWVVEKNGLRQIATWQRCFRPFKLSINISAMDLCRLDFVERVVVSLARHGVPPSAIELEITEGALVQSPEAASTALDQLRNAGISVAIDDFGSGFSNLAQLHRFPVDVLKIDRTLISSILASEQDALIVRSAIEFAHALGYTVVAEGVEDQTLYAVLEQSLCDEIQGYYVSRPMTAEAFEKWIRQHSACRLREQEG
ncbi:MAG: diguanylate cyclase/phosphodiesterase (GGDEF & EAL domains) with PAS/PAC sensor(s), partial [uncultured Caballeronia sp.]